MPSHTTPSCCAWRDAKEARHDGGRVAEDVSSPAVTLIDAPVVYYEIADAEPIRRCSDDTVLDMTVSLDGRTFVAGLRFGLEGIMPRKAAYNPSCEARQG